MSDTIFFDLSGQVDPSGRLSGLSEISADAKNGKTDPERQYASEGPAIIKNHKSIREGIKGDRSYEE